MKESTRDLIMIVAATIFVISLPMAILGEVCGLRILLLIGYIGLGVFSLFGFLLILVIIWSK